MKTFTIQPSERPDGVLPYPFHVSENGMIQRQDFWRGNPVRLVGFQKLLDVNQIDLSLVDFIANPERAVNMYAVTANKAGDFATHLNAIERVRVTDEDGIKLAVYPQG